MRALIALVLGLLSLGAAEPTFQYRLDEARSHVAAKVAFLGLASKTAHFPRMKGRITLQPGRLDAIDLDVDLDARGLTAGDAVTLGRLRGPKFFDVERYPAIRFEGRRMAMTGPVSARVDGSITARGITRPAVLDVTFRQPPARATGREPVELSARTTIDRRAFGMTSYGLIVGRNVAITIDARMIPASPSARE